MAAISLIDADRQWTKAGVGLEARRRGTARRRLLRHAIGHDADPWVVTDAAADP